MVRALRPTRRPWVRALGIGHFTVKPSASIAAPPAYSCPSMQVAILKETFKGERRVALVPADVPKLAKAGIEVLVESGAGAAAGFADEAYTARGAKSAPPPLGGGRARLGAR